MSAPDFGPSYINVEQRGDVFVVEVADPHLANDDNIEGFGQELFLVLDKRDCRKMALTLAGMDVVSSSFLGKLITLHRRLHRRNGKLVICDLKERMARTFRTTRLDSYFTICDTMEDAFELLG
jgi:anti-anti-sigma factor